MVLPSAIRQAVDRWSFEAYVTDALRVLTENTAVPAAYYTEGKEGKSMAVRWAERDKPPLPEEKRTPDEVVADMLGKLRGVR